MMTTHSISQAKVQRHTPVVWLVVCLISSLIFLVAAVWAGVPWSINYQGRLSDASGKSVKGTYSFTFRLYDASTGGNKVWEEAQGLTLSEEDSGVFSCILGSATALTAVDFNTPLWLSIQVGSDSEMTPRQRLTSSGYALNADMVDGLDSAKFLRSDVDTATSGKLTITRSGAALLILPSTDPAADTKLIDVQNAAGTSKFSVDIEGDVTLAGNLTVTGSVSGSTTTSGTSNTTWAIDNDNTSGTEPASGAGISIEGGSGDASLLWDATNDELDINKSVNVSGTLTATSINVGSSSVGDVTDVGSCSSGACFTSSSPGTSVVFTNATSGSVTLQTISGALGTKTVSLPATTGTVVTTGDSGTVTGTMIADGSSGVSLTSDVTGVLPLANGGTNASLSNCSSGQGLTVTSGAVACTSSITASTVTTHTLDNAFDDGKTIDGANSSANAMQVGDGSDDVLLYTASSVPTIATDGTSDLTIAPDGSDVNITGDITIDTKAISTTTPAGGLFIAEDTTAANSDGVIYLGKNNTTGESPETGGWEYIRWDDDYSIEGKGVGAFYFSDAISVEQQEIRGASPAGISFGVGSNNKQSFIYDPSGSSFMFSGGQLAQQFRNLIKNGSFEAFSALETFSASTATGGTGGSGSLFWGGWSNFAPDEWIWTGGKVFQRAPILLDPSVTITSSNLQKDYYHGKSALSLEDTNLASANSYNDTVTNYGTINDGHLEQTITDLQPSTVYAVGVYMLTRNSADSASGASTTEAIIDITGEDTTTNTTLSAALDATTNKEMAVSSTSGFPDSGVLLVGSERISYSGKEATKFFQLIRGFEGTTAASHSSAATATIAPFKHITTSGSTTAGQYTLYTAQFASDSKASDVKIHLICKSVTSGDQCRFDGVQASEGRTVPEFQPSAIVDTGDQTIYGSVRMGRTSDGRGGILAVDKSVRTRAIEFFEKDPGMSGTTGGFGGVGTVTKIGSGSGSTITMTNSGSYFGANPRDVLVTITQVSPAKFKWEYRECFGSTGCSGSYVMGGSNLNVTDYTSSGSQYNMPLPGSMGIIVTFANTSTVTTSDQWSFFVSGMDMGAQYNSYSGTSTYTPGQTRIYKDPFNQKLTFQDGTTIVTLDQIATSGIGSPAHVDYPLFFPSSSGGGSIYLNTSQGYTGTTQVNFDVEIDGNGSGANRDTFRWRDNVQNGGNGYYMDWDGSLIQIPSGGGPYGPFPIPGGGGSTYGFTITFGSPSGTYQDGATGDRWQIRAYPSSGSSVIKTLTANQGASVSGSGDSRNVGLIDCAANQVLKRNPGDTDWVCATDENGGGSGTITAVGDIASGAAFTSTAGADGNSLYFEGTTSNTAEIQLTAAEPSADVSLTLPAVSSNSTLISTGNLSSITSTGTLAGLTATGAVSLGNDSGTVVLDGTNFDVASTGAMSLTGHVTLSGDTNEGLSGGGLADCDTAGSSKLLWDSTTNKFSCGTDQNTGGTPAISVLTAAAGANTIANGDNAQTWNWALSTADKIGFTFGETTASAATGTPAILRTSTLANSTAIPLYAQNYGSATSFRVDDVSGDTTPFIIDAAGNVGIGDPSPAALLTVGSGDLFQVASTGQVLAPRLGFSNNATPEYSFVGDSDTGMFNNLGALDFAVDGVKYLEINPTGMGFFNGGTSAAIAVQESTASMKLVSRSGVNYIESFNTSLNPLDLKFSDLDGVNTWMTIKSTGSIGIGTTGPDRKLDVLDASNPQLRLTRTDGSVYTDFQNAATTGLAVTGSNLTSSSGSDLGYSLTRSFVADAATGTNSATPVFLNMAPTVNLAATGGTNNSGYTGIKLNVTETAIGSGTKNLLDLQVGNSSKFTVNSAGGLTTALTYAASAQPKRTIVLTGGGAIIAPSAGFADQKRTDGTNFSYYTLDFDQSTDEKAFWEFVVPESLAASSDITVTLFWTAAAGSAAQKVDWEISTTSLTDDDVWDSALGTATTINDSLIATNDLHKSAEGTIASANNAWAAGKLAIVKVVRDADDATNDTLAADAKLVMVKIEWTAAAESD